MASIHTFIKKEIAIVVSRLNKPEVRLVKWSNFFSENFLVKKKLLINTVLTKKLVLFVSNKMNEFYKSYARVLGPR